MEAQPQLQLDEKSSTLLQEGMVESRPHLVQLTIGIGLHSVGVSLPDVSYPQLDLIVVRQIPM